MFKTLLTLALFCLGMSDLRGDILAKVDLGPAFAHIDVLESGHTVKRMDMWAVRGDFAYRLYEGFYIKPSFLYGNGGAAEGGIFVGALGVGFVYPLKEGLLISPTVGGNYCHVWTKIDIPQIIKKNLRENFKSWAPFIGLEVYYTFLPSWRVHLGVQYAWARTHTSIQIIGNSKNRSQGFTYTGLLEHDLCENWSINLGAAYNLSLTKEKHGLRGTGVKLGLVRWF